MSWTSRFNGREWQVTSGRLISRDPEHHVRTEHRTLGEPLTMRRYLVAWGEEIRAASKATGVPRALLMATIATENGPARAGETKGLRIMPPKFRREPGYESDEATPHRLSVGPCHLLLSTAGMTRAELSDLGANIMAAARYIARGEARTGWDPILVAARYNSGGLYDASSVASRFHNRWHLRSWGAHLDRFADWYGDALFVLGERIGKPEVRPPRMPLQPRREVVWGPV